MNLKPNVLQNNRHEKCLCQNVKKHKIQFELTLLAVYATKCFLRNAQ